MLESRAFLLGRASDLLASSWAAEADPGAVARPPEVAAWDPVGLEAAANAPPAFAAVAADEWPPSTTDLLKPSDDLMLASSWVAAADPGAVARSPEVAAWDLVGLEPAANAPPAFTAVPWSPTNRRATYLVAGSFSRLGYAEQLAEWLDGYPATIKSAVVGEQVYYRVLTGPYSGDEIVAARKRLTMSGVGDIWVISLCTADLGPPPCTPAARLPKSPGGQFEEPSGPRLAVD